MGMCVPWWFSETVWKLTARFSKHMKLVIGATRLQHIKPLGTSRLRAMFPRLRQEVSRPRCLLGSTRREQPLQLRADRLWSCPFVSTSLIQAAKMLVYSPLWAPPAALKLAGDVLRTVVQILRLAG